MSKQKIKKKLRFAALIRVSTERQSKNGESLSTQEKQIRDAVKNKYNGKLLEEHIYKGQEHSGPGFEREILNRLLNDAQNNIFDAVIVADISRWGRENKKCKEALEILRKNEIRFYDVHSEYDLTNDHDVFMLGMMGEIHEFQSRLISSKSMDNRIERAKKGFPSFGSKPFGYRVERVNHDGTAKWEIIPECKTLLEKAANIYLSKNIGFDKLSTLLKEEPEWNLVKKNTSIKVLASTSLADILINRSVKSEYKIKPKNKKYNNITIKLPEPLLPKTIVNAVKEKAAKNRVKMNRNYEYNYPLSGILFCKECGKSLTGLKNGKYRYYRHHAPSKKGSRCVDNIRANEIENGVLYEISLVIDNISDLETALNNALTSNAVDMIEIKERRSRIKILLKDLNKKRSRFMASVGMTENKVTRAGLVKEAEYTDIEIDKYQERLESIESTLCTVARSIDKRIVRNISQQLKAILGRKYIGGLSNKEKSDLFQYLIGGFSIEERKRLKIGVFVSDEVDEACGEKFKLVEINGLLIGNINTPLTNSPYIGDFYHNQNIKKIELFDYTQFLDNLGKIKSVVPATVLSCLLRQTISLEQRDG